MSDSASEFGVANDATINALGWFTDVPISIKDKDGKTVTATGNFTHIDNGEPEPMLCLGMTWIRKVQGVLDPNKNQFRMKLHGKAYIIPTFSKVLVVKDLPKEEQDQASADSSSLTSDRDLKKSV
ncbi:hypothetical protein C1645_841473 [Glomus cerebriforme]|uniref:Uncharacterized protein n=1 Tax=Glomus cerebriforme TaxID=658196 RepID=A0A397S323_9GLOM|nr:hypothetical protein C1645_841473 [Glomus cerebriforme]